MRVIRIIVYDMSPECIAEQLANSLPDGVKKLSRDRKITVVTLGTLPPNVELLMSNIEEPTDVVDSYLEDFNTAGGDN